jgi:hypothetical protein
MRIHGLRLPFPVFSPSCVRGSPALREERLRLQRREDWFCGMKFLVCIERGILSELFRHLRELVLFRTVSWKKNSI